MRKKMFSVIAYDNNGDIVASKGNVDEKEAETLRARWNWKIPNVDRVEVKKASKFRRLGL